MFSVRTPARSGATKATEAAGTEAKNTQERRRVRKATPHTPTEVMFDPEQKTRERGLRPSRTITPHTPR